MVSNDLLPARLLGTQPKPDSSPLIDNKRAGSQTVTTGTCLIPLEINPGDEVSVDFGVLGQVACRFTDV